MGEKCQHPNNRTGQDRAGSTPQEVCPGCLSAWGSELCFVVRMLRCKWQDLELGWEAGCLCRRRRETGSVASDTHLGAPPAPAVPALCLGINPQPPGLHLPLAKPQWSQSTHCVPGPGPGVVGGTWKGGPGLCARGVSHEAVETP